MALLREHIGNQGGGIKSTIYQQIQEIASSLNISVISEVLSSVGSWAEFYGQRIPED